MSSDEALSGDLEPVAAAFEERSMYQIFPNPLQEIFFPDEEGTDIKELAEKILRGELDHPIEIDPE